LIVIGGWLWQYYSLVDQVSKTSEDVTQTSHNVSTLQDDYVKYKQDQFAERVKYSAENDARSMQLEYKLLAAISKLSQGQKIDTPAAPALAPTDKTK
jgi:uridine kinase